MKRALIFGFLIMALSVTAQEKKEKVQKGFGVTVTQVQPEFPGGSDSLEAFLHNNLIYPEKAKKEHIEGKVYVGFKVSRTGKIIDPKVISTVSEELDNEAL